MSQGPERLQESSRDVVLKPVTTSSRHYRKSISDHSPDEIESVCGATVVLLFWCVRSKSTIHARRSYEELQPQPQSPPPSDSANPFRSSAPPARIAAPRLQPHQQD